MKKKIYIPNSDRNRNRRFGYQQVSKSQNRKIPKRPKQPSEEAVIGNENIDGKKLAMLININALLANVNWLFSIDISDMIRDADPTMQKLLEHPLSRIKEHCSAMLRVVDNLGEEFSEGFEQLSFDLKDVIYEYVRGNRPQKDQ